MLDLSGLNLEKEDKNKIDLSGLNLEKEDKSEMDLSGLGLEKDKKSVTDILEAAGSKLYDGVNKVISPAVNAAKNIDTVTDTIKNTVNPVNVIKNIANSSMVKEYNNTEPILRARTAEDDKAKTIYEPDSFDILGNKIAVASAGGSVKNIEELKKLKDKQDFAVLSAQLPTLALTGAMPVTALAGFAGLQQLKNLIVTKAKGEKYSPMQIRMLAETLPEDTNEYIKLGASLLEAVGDTAVIGAGVNKFKKTLLSDAANNTIDKLKKAGYKVSPEQEKQFKTAIDKAAKNISPDDAVAINIKTKMAKIPQAEKPINTDVNIEPGRIETGKNIVKVNSDVNIKYNDTLENITKQVKNTEASIIRQRLANVIENPTEETSKNLPSNINNKEFEPVKGNIYKINNSSYGIYIGEKNGLLGFITYGNGINYISPNNVLVDVSTNYPQVIEQPIENIETEQTDSIINDDSNIDTSFNPAEWDENYAKQLEDEARAKEEYEQMIIEELKQDGAIPTIKSEKQRLKDMGIGRIVRPKKGDPNYGEYEHLSPRIRREFFYDEKDGIINNKGYTWDQAEHTLQEATGNDNASIWEELESIDRIVGKYEDLGLAVDGKTNNEQIKATKNIEDSVIQNDTLQKINCPITKPVDSVQITITPNVIKYSDLHKKAKAGDLKSAYELVDKIFDTNGKSASVAKNIQGKIEQLKALKEKYPNAVIVPLWSIEKAGKNKIPLAYAGKIRRITGLKLYDKIKQINKTYHTGSGAMYRIVDKAMFSGEVVPNLQYILVDDIFTMGANINELRKYIERNGGTVVATSCLGAGQGGANIGDDKNAKILYNKFSKGAVDDYVRKNNIAESSEELTELQARQLIQQAEQADNTARIDGDGQRNGRVESVGEITGSEVLRGRVTADTLTELENKLGNLLIDKFFQQENLANTAREFTSEQAKYLSKFKNLKSIKNKADEVKKEIEKENGSVNLSLGGKGRAAYSSALKTDVKIKNNETPKEKDFKLYQRTYDLAKKYMVSNIAESKYRPKNTLGVYYNYGSRKGNIYLNSLLNVDVVAHELVHAIDDQQQIITDLYDKGFTANTTYKGKRAFTTFVPDINTFEGKAAAEILKACKDLYPVDISKQSVKNRLAEGLATIIQHSIINPDMIENLYPNAYKWAMGNDTLQSFRNDARQIVVDYESLNPVEQLTTEIYDKAQKVKDKTKIPLGVRIDSQLFDSEAVLKMLDKDLYLTAKGYRTVLKGILENNLTNKKGKMYIIDNHGNPVKVSDTVNWRTLIEDVQKAQSEFNGYLVARRFVAWYDMRDKLANGLVISGNNLKKLQKRYDEVSKKIKEQDFYNIHDQKTTFQLEQDLKREIDKLTKKIEQDGAKLQELQSILAKSGKNEEKIKEAYKFLDNTQNRELAKKYDFLMKCNLTVLRTAKLIDKDMYNELVANYGYAPFNRVAYNELTGDGKEFVEKIGAKNDVIPKIVSSNWNIKNLKKIEGSELPILSPLYSSIQLMKEAYKKSYKQLIANRMGEIAELYPDLMQKVPYTKGDEKNNSKLVVVGTNRQTGKDIKQTLEMDPFVKKVWDSLIDNYQMSLIEKLMVAPAKFFTLMTTAENPVFATTNFARDQITAAVNSDMGYVPFFSPLMSYVKCRQNPELKQYYDEYNELFGDNKALITSLDEVNPDDLAEAFKTNTLSKIFGGARKVLSFLPNLSEVVTRRTEYVKARAAGFDIITAKRMADEVSVPFGDRGLWGGGFGRSLLRSVPYMNASLQVIRQGVRSLLTTKGNNLLERRKVVNLQQNNKGVYEYKEKNKFLKTLFAMIGYGIFQFVVSLWWDNIKDETRKNLKEQLNPAQFLRFAYLPFGLNNTDLLRLPWEQLYSFPAVIAAMIHDEIKNEYDYKLSEYAETLTGGVIPDNFNVVVPLLKTLIEKDNSGWEQLMYRNFPQIVKIGLMLGGGKKTYPTLQDIVPKYLQKREKALQYDEKTSNIAKFLGKQFNIAPIKIDYYIYNVAGQVGSILEKGAEFIFDKLSGKTQTDLADFVTGNVSEKEKAFRKSVIPWLQESYFIYGREMQQFYDERERFEALEKSYKEGLRKLTSEELNYLRLHSPYIKGISKKITAYNKFVKNSTDSRKKLTFKQQKDNEKTKIQMENEIVNMLRKYKKAVKKAA
jgi:hypothetical protein